MIVDRELFLKQVQELALTKQIDRKDLEILLDIVSGEEHNIDIDSQYLADKIINDLFKLYTVETLVPWDFFSTEIGKAILFAKFGLEESEVYFTSELAEMTGFSKQYISKEIKNNNISHKKKGGIIYFSEKQVDNYLRKKGLQTISEKKDLKYKEIKEKIIYGGYERQSKYGEE